MITGSRLARHAAFLIFALVLTGCMSAQQRREQQQARLRCLIQGVDSTDPDRTEAAVEDIGSMGTDAALAVPVLSRALTQDRGDQELRLLVLEALGRIGGAAASAVPSILFATAHDAALIPQAEQALRRIGPKGEAAVVQRLRRHTDWRIRREAARLLYGAQRSDVDAALLQALEGDRRGEVRQAAAQTLGERGVPRAAPQFQRSLQDDHWGTALASAHALKRLGAQGERVLRATLLHSRPVASLVAATALDEYDGRALPQWQKGLVSQQAEVRAAAVVAIGKLGAEAISQVAPVLKDLLTDPSEDVQQVAEEVLAQVEGF